MRNKMNRCWTATCPEGRSMLAFAMVLLACGCTRPQPEPVLPPVPVRTVRLATEAPQAAELYPLSFVRDREANLSFRVSGVIATLMVRSGQTVHAGQVLATLTPTPYAAARLRAEADVNRLQRAARRNRELLGAGAIPGSTLEDTDDALVAARAALDAARYDEASASLIAPFAGIVLSRDAERGEQVSPGQRVLRLADLQSSLIAKAEVPATMARSIRVGDTAKLHAAGQVLPATVRFVGAQSDPRTTAVTIDLVLRDAPDLVSGTTGSMSFDPSDHGIDSAMGDGRRGDRAFGKRENAARRTAAASLLLPPEALLEVKDGLGAVYVFDTRDGRAHRTAIRVLGFEGEMLRIAGLEQGVKVLTAGAGFVVDGQKVQEIAP